MVGGPSLDWTLVAETGQRFSSFAPYVPSVDEQGRVAFQAELRSGGSGVFVGDGDGVDDVVAPPTVTRVTSHPDLDGRGATSFYGELAGGGPAVLLHRDGEVALIASQASGFVAVGPAGPTMNAAGAVAFRACRAPGRPGVFLWSGGVTSVLAETGDEWSGFEGLPVVGEDGAVVVRADRPDGVAGIYSFSSGLLRVVAETGERFGTLARFPTLGWDGSVAFAATLPGGEGVVVVAGARGTTIVDETGAYESFRGVLRSGEAVVRLATPRGEALGLFSGPDPVRDRVLAIGDPLLGSTVVDLAANPVSVSAAGHLVLRGTLADGRQLILRTRL